MTLGERELKTTAGVFQSLAAALASSHRPPYFAVDEAQDLSVTQPASAPLGADRPNALFFAGDLGQRIFQAPFSWRRVDIRGRSRTLRVNPRHTDCQHADRLLDRR
jgi:hypothetical protein